MEYIRQLIGNCGFMRPFQYVVEEILDEDKKFKTLLIRFVPMISYEINWTDASCFTEDGILNLYYFEHKVAIPFDKSYDYVQAKINIEGNMLVVLIPSRTRVVNLLPINKEATVSNNSC